MSGHDGINALRWTGPDSLRREVEAAASAWDCRPTARGALWARDASLWTSSDEARWLGWLDGVEAGRRLHPELDARSRPTFAAADFTHALLLGMGGSSLCPEVLARDVRPRARADPSCTCSIRPTPAQVLARGGPRRSAPARSSSSPASRGATLEPHVFLQYFFDRVVHRSSGASAPGRQFVAITDPGIEAAADRRGRRLPARRAGRADDWRSLLGALARSASCRRRSRASTCRRMLDDDRPHGGGLPRRGRCRVANPGVALGLVLGSAARRGRDKLTLVASPADRSDSGRGSSSWSPSPPARTATAIIPVDLERLAPPNRYGDDRLFVYLRLGVEPDADAGHRRQASSSAAGHPVVQIDVHAGCRRSSSAGRSRRRSPARSWASTRSTSPTSRPARSRRAR